VSMTFSGTPIDLTSDGSGSSARAIEILNEVYRRGTGTWHDRYKFRVLVDEQVIAPSDYAAVLTLINRYKPVSRWCEGIVRAIGGECDIGWAGMLLRFVYHEIEAPNYP